MEFLDLAKKRFSVLEYSDTVVEQEKIDKIIAAGIAAPTACNNQPQRILIIDNDTGRQKLNRVIPSKYYVPVAFLICYDRQKCWTRPMDGKCSGDIDASIVATHMMMEATDLGLGTIWVMYWDPKKMKDEFGLEDNTEPVALLIAGYKAKTAEPRPGHLSRKSKEDIVL